MKVSRDKVIERNLSLLRKIVPDIRVGDSAQVLSNRIGDRVVVTPDNPPNPEEQTTIVINLDSVMAVSKGANLDEIVNLLSVAANGSFAALGTSLAGTMQAADGLAGASVNTLKRIMSTTQEQNNISILVPVTDIQHSNGSIDMKVEASLEGWTRTNDWDSDEIANLSFHAQLLNEAGNPVTTKNVGKSSQIPLTSDVSAVTKRVSTGETLAQVEIGWQLSTDGAFTHDTISLVQLAALTITLTYPSTP